MNKKLLVDCITFDVDKSVLNEAMAKGGPLVVQVNHIEVINVPPSNNSWLNFLPLGKEMHQQ